MLHLFATAFRGLAGALSRASHALLSDRVRILHGRPQRYATQWGADRDSRFVYAIADPHGLAARRASLRLAPLAADALDGVRVVHPVAVRGATQ